MKKQKLVIVSAIGLILFFMVAGYVYKDMQNTKNIQNIKSNYSSLVREHSVKKGNEKAKVQLVEFFDPACATCADFHPLVSDIMKKNEGNIKLVMRYAPFHPGSKDVVRMLEAAKMQGKYWETLELVFDTQELWISGHTAYAERLWKYLPQAGLDINRLVKDMENPEIDRIIKQDLEDARTLGANKTPAYFVNGKPLQRFGYEQLKDLIYSEL